MQQRFRDATVRLENEHWWYRARRAILDRAVDRLVGETDLALTIGVGISREAEMLRRRSRLVTIDRAPLDPRCREIAWPARADAVALPFTDASFDAVFLFDVLEHIDADELALAEIRRVLRPGGRVLLTVPAFMFLFGLQDVVSEHKRRYRRSSLTNLVQRAGFRVRYATYFNTLLFPPIAAVRVLRRLLPARSNAENGALAGRGGGDFDLRLPRPAERMLEGLFALEQHAIDRARLPFGVSILLAAVRA